MTWEAKWEQRIEYLQLAGLWEEHYVLNEVPGPPTWSPRENPRVYDDIDDGRAFASSFRGSEVWVLQ